MKKIICMILALVMLSGLISCNSKEPENNAESTSNVVTSEILEDPDANVSPVYGQDPLAVIPGNYTATDRRAEAVIKLLALGVVSITINGSNGASDYTEWSMTGEIDDNLTISFKDDVMKNVTLDENGDIVDEDVKYTDGSGTIVFDKNAVKFTWEDKKSEQGPVTFTLNKD